MALEEQKQQEARSMVVPSSGGSDSTMLPHHQQDTAAHLQDDTTRKDPSSTKKNPLLWDHHSPCKESDDDTDDDSYYAELGLLFESNQPVRIETHQWQLVDTVVKVRLAVADDISGCVHSGLYLWPAAERLAAYVVNHLAQCPVRSVVELGAGCGLVSLTALQVWQNSLQCLVVTDQDPNTLARARDNLESTMQALINEADDDDDKLNIIINSLASIPVAFESLEWGDTVDSILRNQVQEHSQFAQAHMILGSDLISDVTVIQNLLRSVHALMAPTGSCYLAQSVEWDAEAELEMKRVCEELGLSRTLVEETDGCRIEEFTHEELH